MTIKHIPDGAGFEFPREFGFHGSATPERKRFATGGTVHGGNYAEGGEVEHEQEARADHAEGGHMHPHGHEVVHVERHHDGSVTHHHVHGGFTHHHADGHISHHAHDGSDVEHMAHGGMEQTHDSSEWAHRANGGHMGDREMIHEADTLAKNVKKHETEEMREEKGEGEHMAFGGIHRPMMPRGGMPHPGGSRVMAPRPGTPPPSSPAGGAMPMGVQPSDEAGSAGGSGISQMSKGGAKHRGRRD